MSSSRPSFDPLWVVWASRSQWLAGTASVIAIAVAAGLPARPALAACQVSGNTAVCTGLDTVGLGDGTQNNRTVTVESGASIITTTAIPAIWLNNNNTVTNNGTINAQADAAGGIAVNANSTIVNTGNIKVANGGARAIELSGANNSVTNYGSIVAGDDITTYGIRGAGGNATDLIQNYGSITVGTNATGIRLSARNAAPVGADIVNTGTITAGENGNGIYVEGRHIIANSGIVGAGTNGVGVLIDGPSNTLNNSGTIRGGATGFSVFVCDCATGTNVNNLAGGTLDGRINFDGNGNTLTNSGLITITNPGTLIGFPAFRLEPQFAAFTTGNTFIQTAQGTLALRMDNTGAIDTLTADTIQPGGTLKVVIQPQLYQARTFTGTAVGLTGNGAATINAPFDSYVSSSPFFRVTPVYDNIPTAYTVLSIQLDRIGFGSVAGLTLNQQRVGSGLEGQYSSNLDPNSAAGQLFSNLLAATSVSALDQLSGEGTAALQNAAFSAGSLFNNASLGQLVFGDGSGAASVIVPPAQYAATTKPRGHEAFAAIKAPAAPPAVQPGRWRIWTLGFGGYRSVDGEALTLGNANQTMRTYGGALGADYQVSPDLLLGFAAGGSDSSFSVPNRATSGNITAGHFGLYGLKTWGAYYAAASASYARLANSTTRTIAGVGPTETATGQFGSDQLSGRLELGWKRAFARFNLTPFVAIEPAVLWSQGYSETSTTAAGTPGILGLTFASRTTTSLPTFVGLQADARMVFASGVTMSPYGRLSWVHEFEPSRQINPTFISVPGASFTVDGARAARDAARLDAGTKLALDSTRSLFANLSGEWSGSGESYSVSAGFRLTP